MIACLVYIDHIRTENENQTEINMAYDSRLYESGPARLTGTWKNFMFKTITVHTKHKIAKYVQSDKTIPLK